MSDSRTLSQQEPTLPTDLPLEVLEQIDRICAEYEAEWKAGRTPVIETALANADSKIVPTLLQQLLLLEVEYLRTRDAEPTLADYRDRFTDHTEVIEAVFAESSIRANFENLPRVNSRVERIGDYLLLDTIARGGMGMVYKAWQVSLSRTVALKTILAAGGVSEEQIARFRTEAESMAALDHPGIVPIYEVGEANGQYFFTMAYVDGLSLSEQLRKGPLPARDAAGLVARTAEIVESAHSQGVVHRDLKPGNILLDEQGQPHVTDFGLAKQVDRGSELTRTGQVLGTPSYMPPEQASGHNDVGPAADIYALGAVLYATLTSHPPFQSANAVDTLRQVIDEEPPPLRLLNPGLDRDLETICLKCLEKDPANRYESAAALAADLRCWLAGEPITARRGGAVERAIKWSRRKPAVAALIIASIVALMGLSGAAVALWNNDQLQDTLAETRRARSRETSARLAETRQREKTEQALAKEEIARSEAEQARKLETVARREAETARQSEARARADAESAEHRARRSDYLRRIALARLEWQSGHTKAVSDLLIACPPEWRGWEWRYIARINQQQRAQMYPRGRSISSLDVSRDGAWLLVGHGNDLPGDPILTIRDARTTKIVRSFDTKTASSVRHVIPSQDRSWLLVHRSIRSPDGERVDRIERWDAKSGEVLKVYIDDLRSIALGLKNRIALSHDDQRFAHASFTTKQVELWDVAKGDTPLQLSHNFEQPNGKTVTLAPTSVVFSPDGRLLAAGFTRGQIVVWDMSNGQVRKVLTLSDVRQPVQHITFDRQGQRLAALAGPTVQIWKVNDFAQSATMETGNNPTQVVFDPTGKMLAVVGRSQLVQLWDAESGRPIADLHGHMMLAKSAVFTSDGGVVSAGIDNRLLFWDPTLSSGEATVHRYDQPVFDLEFSPDGKWLAVCGGAARERTSFLAMQVVENGREKFRKTDFYSSVTGVAFTPDGTSVATSNWSHLAGLYNAESGTQERKFDDGVNHALETVAIDPKGRWLISAGLKRGFVARWDLSFPGAPTRVKLPDKNDNVLKCGFSHDGRWFVAATQTGAVVWSTGDWVIARIIRNEMEPGDGIVRGLAMSPVAHQFVTTDNQGHTHLWDMTTGKRLQVFARHQLLAADAAFSPDGSRLATASHDGTAKIWDVATGEELLTLTGHVRAVKAVAFSPDGHRLATAGEDGTVRIYNAAPRNR